MSVTRRTIKADGSSTMGRVARLIANGFFVDTRRFSETLHELERTGTRLNNKTLATVFKELVVAGFLSKEGKEGYRAVPGMQHIVEAA